MELSKRTQTIIALVSGALLGAVLVATAMQGYYKSQIDQLVAERTTQTSQQATTPAPTESTTPATTPIAETTTAPANDTPAPPNETPAEPTAQTDAAPTPATEPAPANPAAQTPPAAQEAAAPATPQPATTASATTYTYTAQPGDSYSVLARKAIQTYGLSKKLSLSPAQIIAAEAALAIQAGSPELNEGQSVTIDQSAVKSAVESAQKLSADETAAWQTYTYDVEFNTNANGQ